MKKRSCGAQKVGKNQSGVFACIFMWSDENECEDELTCDEDEYCINTDGSYKCVGE